MVKRNRFVLIATLAITFLLIFTIVMIDNPKKAVVKKAKKFTDKTYNIAWEEHEIIHEQLLEYANKNSVYKKEFKLNTPNLKEICIRISWIDDKTTFFANFGLDSFTLTITTPDGQEFTRVGKSLRMLKIGGIEIIIPIVQKKPKVLNFYSEDLVQIGQILKENYFDYSYVDKTFGIKISCDIGEIRPLKRLRDNGNEFSLEIKYTYYQAFIRGGEVIDNHQINNTEPINISANMSPAICTFCGEESLSHDPWCPYFPPPPKFY